MTRRRHAAAAADRLREHVTLAPAPEVATIPVLPSCTVLPAPPAPPVPPIAMVSAMLGKVTVAVHLGLRGRCTADTAAPADRLT